MENTARPELPSWSAAARCSPAKSRSCRLKPRSCREMLRCRRETLRRHRETFRCHTEMRPAPADSSVCQPELSRACRASPRCTRSEDAAPPDLRPSPWVLRAARREMLLARSVLSRDPQDLAGDAADLPPAPKDLARLPRDLNRSPWDVESSLVLPEAPLRPAPRGQLARMYLQPASCA